MKQPGTFTSARMLRGFTTVEMWTAAAVGIALLCCLAYGFAASEKNAKRSGCLTHLRTIYTAMATYSVDNDGALPPFAFDAYGSQLPNAAAFISCLGPQGLKPDTWFCPADSHAHSAFSGLWSNFRVSSYGMPPSTLAKGKDSAGNFSLAMPVDSLTVLFCDQPLAGATSSHGSRLNAMFGDGHVAITPVAAVIR